MSDPSTLQDDPPQSNPRAFCQASGVVYICGGGVQKMVKWLEKKSEQARVVQSDRENRVPKKRGKKRAKLITRHRR